MVNILKQPLDQLINCQNDHVVLFFYYFCKKIGYLLGFHYFCIKLGCAWAIFENKFSGLRPTFTIFAELATS